MARRKTTPPPLESVKLPADVMRSARVIAGITGVPISELLAEILRPALARREKAELERRAKELGGG